MPDGNINFRVETPGDPVDLAARMARNEARPLQDATPHKSCIIVGSGPSALSEALWDRVRHELITTVALNGALSLFIERGLAPTIWACCDPQELVNAFIPPDPPRHTLYLLASKCPESLFERLKHNWVDIWRIDELDAPADKLRVPTAVSISLVAQSLMRYRGFTRLEHYGWDACCLSGKHHASDQAGPEQRMQITLQSQRTDKTLGTFDTAGPWFAELRDAGLQAHNLTAMGYEIVVHGNGMIATFLNDLGLAKTPDIR